MRRWPSRAVRHLMTIRGSGLRGTDLRMPLLGLAAWGGAPSARFTPAPAAGSARRPGPRRGARRGAAPGRRTALLPTVVAVLLVGYRGGRRRDAGSGPRRWATRRSRSLARARAVEQLTGRVVGDPRSVAGRFGTQVLPSASRPGGTCPCRCFGGDDWRRLALGARVRSSGRLGPVRRQRRGALVPARDQPEVVDRRGPRGGGRPRRCGPRSASRWRTGPPRSGRWYRRWSTVTTRRCPRSWSGLPDHRADAPHRRVRAPT